MRIALLLLLVGCWRSSPPPAQPIEPAPTVAAPHAARPACDRDAWLLLRAVRQCHDIRGGYSGYWVLEVVDGRHAGKTVMASYGEGERSPIHNWNLSKAVTFGTLTPSGRWPNSCTQITVAGAQPISYDASVSTIEPNAVETFDDEAAARAALATRC